MQVRDGDTSYAHTSTAVAGSYGPDGSRGHAWEGLADAIASAL